MLFVPLAFASSTRIRSMVSRREHIYARVLYRCIGTDSSGHTVCVIQTNILNVSLLLLPVYLDLNIDNILDSRIVVEIIRQSLSILCDIFQYDLEMRKLENQRLDCW